MVCSTYAYAHMQVEVYGRPGEADTGLDAQGVLWAPWWALPCDGGGPASFATAGSAGAGDAAARAEGEGGGGGELPAPPVAPVAQAYVAWRDYASVLVMRGSAVRRLVWLHDTYEAGANTAAEKEGAVTAYLVLSAQHARLVPPPLRSKTIVTRNGVPALFFDARQALAPPRRNVHRRFVYASMPSRGLMYVLQAWPTIHACLARAGANASLDVYYGFTAHDEQLAAKDARYGAWMADMQGALDRASALGVQYKGMRGHAELARALGAAGFYLYPSDFPETSCIALMQAQAAGAVPITSRYAHSALPETAGVFDLGPAPLPVDPVTNRGHVPREWLIKWANRVCYVAGAHGVQAAEDVLDKVRRARPEFHGMPRVDMDGHRRQMIEWSHENLGWDAVAASWGKWLWGSAEGR